MIKLWNVTQPNPCYADGTTRHYHVAGFVLVYRRTKRTMRPHWGPALYAERKAQWHGTITRTGVQAH